MFSLSLHSSVSQPPFYLLFWSAQKPQRSHSRALDLCQLMSSKQKKKSLSSILLLAVSVFVIHGFGPSELEKSSEVAGGIEVGLCLIKKETVHARQRKLFEGTPVAPVTVSEVTVLTFRHRKPGEQTFEKKIFFFAFFAACVYSWHLFSPCGLFRQENKHYAFATYDCARRILPLINLLVLDFTKPCTYVSVISVNFPLHLLAHQIHVLKWILIWKDHFLAGKRGERVCVKRAQTTCWLVVVVVCRRGKGNALGIVWAWLHKLLKITWGGFHPNSS